MIVLKINPLFALLFLVSAASAESNTETSPSNYSWLPTSGRTLFSAASANANLGIFSGDAMQPLIGTQEKFFYGDFATDYATDATYLMSPGIGYRGIVNNQIFGAYAFADYEKTSLGQNFWVLSPGVEWMSAHWDAHVNGYFPTQTEQQTGNVDWADNFGVYQYEDLIDGTNIENDAKLAPYAVIGNGVDTEIGYSFEQEDHLRSRVYVGTYYYQPHESYDVSNITGGTAGFTKSLTQNLSGSLFNSYDNVNHYALGISLTYVFGGESNQFSTDVASRMLDPVERHVGIIDTGAGTYDQQHLEVAGYGQEYDDVWEVSANGTGSGLIGDPAPLNQTTLDNINAENPDGARIYIQGDSTYNVNTGTTNGNSSYYDENTGTTYYGLSVYSGQDFFGTTADYKAPATGSDRPIIAADAEHDYNAFIVKDAGENSFSDLTITEYTTSNTVSGNLYTIAGIAVLNEGNNNLTVNLDDVNITGMDTYGMYAENNGNGTMTLNITDTTMNYNAVVAENINIGNAAGLYAVNDISSESNTGTLIINATNSQFNHNGILTYNGVDGDFSNIANDASGMQVMNYGDGAVTITANNSQFNGNGETQGTYSSINDDASGLHTENNGNSGTFTINATNSQFNGNGIATGNFSNVDADGIFAGNDNTGTFVINTTNSSFNNNGVASGDNSSITGGDSTGFASGMYLFNVNGTMDVTTTNSTFNGNGVASGENSSLDVSASGIYATNFGNGILNITASNSQFNGNGVLSGTNSTMTANDLESDTNYASGIYLATGNDSSTGDASLSVTNSEFNGNGVVSGTNSSLNADASGIYVDDDYGYISTVDISIINSTLNGNGVASGSGSTITGNGTGLYVENDALGAVDVVATGSEFNGNGIGTVNGIEAGMYINNDSTMGGTISVTTNSSFDNNGQYGIYGVAASETFNTTYIDYTGSSFSDNGTAKTNESSLGNDVNWTS